MSHRDYDDRGAVRPQSGYRDNRRGHDRRPSTLTMEEEMHTQEEDIMKTIMSGPYAQVSDSCIENI